MQVAIGRLSCLDRGPSSEEWQMLYQWAKQQKVEGIGYHAVEKLFEFGLRAPQDVSIDWMSEAEVIREQNEQQRKRPRVVQAYPEHLRSLRQTDDEPLSPNITPRLQQLYDCYRNGRLDMRLLMDYYFTLINSPADYEPFRGGSWRERLLGWGGMARFAKGVSWLMREAFGLEQEKLSWQPCQHEGRFLMHEVNGEHSWWHRWRHRLLHLQLALLMLLVPAGLWATDYRLSSPDGQLNITVHADKQQLTWEVQHGTTQVLTPSAIGLNGALANMKKAKGSHDANTLTISNRQIAVEFRADNDAAAYHIRVLADKPLTVNDETAQFNFAADYDAFIPYVNDNRGGERYCYSFESYYDAQPLSRMFADSLAINPLAVRLPEGKLAVVADMGATDYPGMFLVKNGQHGLRAAFAPYPNQEVIGGHARLNLVPTERAAYIARDVKGWLPWRIVLVTTRDTQLLNTRLPQRFGPACQIADTSWIRPGKVAWDWWNATMLTGVDFRAGMNTDTYLYYIDFAANNHLEYIIIDEGWSTDESLRSELNPDIDLRRLIDYGRQKGVGIILWSSWRNCIKHTDADFKYYADMGIKGFKVDFFDRDDQAVMRSAWQIAQTAARHHLLLDLHGYRPTGIQVAWPNIVNFEGVKGLENSKWEPRVGDGPLHDQPRYDVTIPYLRQLVGPLDYTPGAMTNATRAQFFGNNDHPMSQGTRAHQVAMYTIFDAPLQMLADAPTKYIREQATTDFISQIPTVFDETIALDGQLGEYVVVARRKGNTWYLAAMTNWQPRDLTVRLDMLATGSHQATLFADGVNADRDATDYKKTRQTVAHGDVLQIHLAPGGGWSAIIQ